MFAAINAFLTRAVTNLTDVYWPYVSMLLHGDSPQQFNQDISTNAFPITAVGAPQANIFSPLKEGYYGNSFNGPTDYLSTATTTALNIPSGAFTVEMWVYRTSTTTTLYDTIMGSPSGANVTWGVYITASTLAATFYTLAGGIVSTTTAITNNAWNHIAISRTAGGNLQIFINGVSGYSASYTSAQAIGTTLYIAGDTLNNKFAGYISNIRYVNGTALYTANFTPPTAPLTAVTNTALLTCQSSRFIDNSANSFVMAPSGGAAVVSSNPFVLPSTYSSYGSGYFNGSSYLKAADSTAFDLSSGDWTIEGWYCLTATPGGNGFTIVSNCNSNTGAGGWGLMVASLSQIYLQGNNNSQGYISFTSALNTWYHVAVIRSGTGANSSSIYVNGVKYTPAGNGAGNPTFASTNIGPYMGYGQVASSYATGYISNVRVVKGTSVYGANPASITVPTAPLTAVTGTSILTLQTNVPQNNNQFFDTSTNNFTLTRYGNTTQGSFNPFVPTYPYSVATNGGSGYFDGTGDYIQMPNNAAINFGSGNFTVECWIWKSSSVNAYGTLCMIGAGGSGFQGFTFEVSSTRGYAWYTQPSPFILLNYNVNPDDSTWHHVAISRTGSTTTMFVDGISRSTYSGSYTIPSTGTTFTVGAEPTPGSYYSGYISNLRLVKGTGLYTANFTPPTAPLTAVTNTSLLLGFTNGAIFDNTMLNNLETVGTAQISTSVFKYGTGSMKFNGTSDVLQAPNNTAFAFGTGDFTVEMWVYPTSSLASGPYVWHKMNGAGGTNPGVGWYIETYGTSIVFGSNTSSTPGVGISANFAYTLTLNAWTYLAFTRVGSVLTLYVNGVQQTPQTITNANLSADNSFPVQLGGWTAYSTTYFPGYIDDLRITKGVARYTATFTPPAAAFPNS